jgi:hypothetical protein
MPNPHTGFGNILVDLVPVRPAPAIMNPPHFSDLSRASVTASGLPTNDNFPRGFSSHDASPGDSPHLFLGAEVLPHVSSSSFPTTTQPSPHIDTPTHPPGLASHLSPLPTASIPRPSPPQSNSSQQQFKHSIQAPPPPKTPCTLDLRVGFLFLRSASIFQPLSKPLLFPTLTVVLLRILIDFML